MKFNIKYTVYIVFMNEQISQSYFQGSLVFTQFTYCVAQS